PHHRVHGQFGGRRLASEDLVDPAELGVGEAEEAVNGGRFLGTLCGRTLRDGVLFGRHFGAHTATRSVAATSPSSSRRPSAEPRISSEDLSGWGMMPTTLPVALATAAARPWEPLTSST